MEIAQILGLALLCRSLTQIFKKVYNKEQKIFHIPEIISIAVGILIACLTNINMFTSLIPSVSPVVHWIFVVITGIIFGQGGSFVYDLWNSFQRAGVKVEEVPTDIIETIEALNEMISYDKLNESDSEKDESSK